MSFCGSSIFQVLTGFTGFYRVLSGFTGFYRVLPGFTGFLGSHLHGQEGDTDGRREPDADGPEVGDVDVEVQAGVAQLLVRRRQNGDRPLADVDAGVLRVVKRPFLNVSVPDHLKISKLGLFDVKLSYTRLVCQVRFG